jgi:hypothetical protein
MVKLVESMLALHPQLAAARTPQEQTVLQRQLAATDTQIDRLVYDLYGLTADEINIVEGKAGAEMPALPAVETVAPAAKPKRVREKSSYAAPPPGPPQAGLTPEKADSDSAHFYGKEEGPP